MKTLMSYIRAFTFSLTTLSRVYIPYMPEYQSEDIKRSSSFFPLVGLILSLPLVSLLLIADAYLSEHLTILFYVFFLMLYEYAITNLFHFDGLMDTIDAFAADKTRQERLEIMKDSRVGSFASAYSFFYLAIKATLLFDLFNNIGFSFLYIALTFVLSRFSMSLLAQFSDYPGDKGLGAGIIVKGNIAAFAISTASTMTFTVLIFLLTSKNLQAALILSAIFILSAVLFSLLFRALAYKKIGGVRGDVLGAANEIGSLLFLAIFVILLREPFFILIGF